MRREGLSYAILGGLLLLIIGCAPAAAPPVALPAAAPSPVVKETPKPAPAKLERVRVGVPGPAPTQGAYLVGKEKGVFTEEGIDLEIIPIQSAMGTAATISGELDFNGSVSTIFSAAVRGAPVKALMSMTSAGIWSIIGGTGISSAQDLKGKGVSIASRGGGAEYAARKALAKIGLDADKDVTFIVIADGAAQLASLKAGSAGGASMFPPFSLLARDEGFKALVNTWDAVDFPGNGMGTREAKLKDNPDQVRRMIRGTLKGMAYMRNYPQETIEYFAKAFGLDRKIATGSYEHVMSISSFDGNITDEGGRQLVDLARSGGVTGTIDPQKHIDLSFLKAAQKELGISR